MRRHRFWLRPLFWVPFISWLSVLPTWTRTGTFNFEIKKVKQLTKAKGHSNGGNSERVEPATDGPSSLHITDSRSLVSPLLGGLLHGKALLEKDVGSCKINPRTVFLTPVNGSDTG